MEEIKTYTLEELTIGKGSYGIAAPAVPFHRSKHTYLRITDINDDGTLNKQGLMCESKKLSMARDTLLPQLMSGELKINDLNR